jgi:hypothetical protein
VNGVGGCDECSVKEEKNLCQELSGFVNGCDECYVNWKETCVHAENLVGAELESGSLRLKTVLGCVEEEGERGCC